MKNSAINTGKIAGALLVGAAIGAAAGMLFAPEKGNRLRKKLGDGAKDLADNLKDRVKNGIHEIKQKV